MAAGAVNVVLVAINFPNGGGGFTGRTDTPDLSGLKPVRTAGHRRGRHGLLPLRGRRRRGDVPRRAPPRPRQAGTGVGGDPRERAGRAGCGCQHRSLQALGVRARVVHGGCRGLPARRAGRPADGAVVPDAGLPHAPRDDAHRRHLQPLGRGRRRVLQPAPAVPLPGAVGDQPELRADPLRRRPAAGAPHGAGRARTAVPEGHGEPRPARLARGRQGDGRRGQRRDRGRGAHRSLLGRHADRPDERRRSRAARVG